MHPYTVDIAISPEALHEPGCVRNVLTTIGIDSSLPWRITKRSIDARKKKVLYRLRIEVGTDQRLQEGFYLKEMAVGNRPEVYIAGAGPCGLFSAIRLIELGFKPVIIERGKDVRSRRRDLAAINRNHVVNPDSNYCFGEGGAGTYSDGKLYTRSTKRGNVAEILHYLVAFGADEDILIDAHPHIGTNKLPALIEAMRHYITHSGGEIRFGTRLTNLETSFGKLKRIQVNGTDWMNAESLVLATGHSARDIFELLLAKGIDVYAKPFALGVRAEHPQHLIDAVQYHCSDRGAYLPPASYSLVHQSDGRGVYSFCMCPGGIIAPCATAPGEIVTNGWSPSKRNNPYANSGMVVAIEPEDYDPGRTGHPLAAMRFQQMAEQAAFALGGGGQTAPAQRLVDFVHRKVSTNLPPCSYKPGLQSAELRECLPDGVSRRLADSLKAFSKKMPAYFTNEAVLVATESRTSSPVRIPRGDDLQHPQVQGLYPAGEGAGYAGGIVSAALDGLRIAGALAINAGRGVSAQPQ